MKTYSAKFFIFAVLCLASISATSSPLAETMNKQGLSKQDVQQRIRRAEELGLYDMAYYLRREMAEMEGTSSPMKSEEREKLREKVNSEWSKFNSQQDEGTSNSKSGSIFSAQCPEDEQLKNLRRSVSSYAKDIDELEDEKRRLDKELERFDKAFAKADAAQSDPFTRFIGMASRQGKEGISAAGTESLSQDANTKSERDKYQKERFALQNQTLRSKVLINEQIRSYQRDLDNSEFQIKTIMSERRELGC